MVLIFLYTTRSLGYNIDSLDFETFGKAQPAEWMNRTLEVYPSIEDFVGTYLDFLTHYRELYPVGDEKTFPALDEYIDVVGYGNRLLEEIGAEHARVLPNGKNRYDRRWVVIYGLEM